MTRQLCAAAELLAEAAVAGAASRAVVALATWTATSPARTTTAPTTLATRRPERMGRLGLFILASLSVPAPSARRASSNLVNRRRRPFPREPGANGLAHPL